MWCSKYSRHGLEWFHRFTKSPTNRFTWFLSGKDSRTEWHQLLTRNDIIQKSSNPTSAKGLNITHLWNHHLPVVILSHPTINQAAFYKALQLHGSARAQLLPGRGDRVFQGFPFWCNVESTSFFPLQQKTHEKKARRYFLDFGFINFPKFLQKLLVIGLKDHWQNPSTYYKLKLPKLGFFYH